MFQFVCTAWKSFSGKFVDWDVFCVSLGFSRFFFQISSLIEAFLHSNARITRLSQVKVLICQKIWIFTASHLYQGIFKVLIRWFCYSALDCAMISPLNCEKFQIYGFRKPNKWIGISLSDFKTRKNLSKINFPLKFEGKFTTFQSNYQKFPSFNLSKNFPPIKHTKKFYHEQHLRQS